MRMTLENLLMSVGSMDTTNQRMILERIQEMNNLLSSFMTNQTTPHLGALSSLINNETSNHRRQSRIGPACTVEWMTSTWTGQYMERAKKVLDSKQRHLMTMEHQRGGDLYFKSGKDACMSSNLKALHIYFYSLQENPQRSPTRLKKKNHWADNNRELWLWPWNEKKMR